jgi:carbonic anhydrase/acetyltransferase-like protein (isoleucine patch superfamily)
MPIILPFRGRTPQIAPDAFIADNATLIGDVTIGPASSIWFGCVLRGDTNFIRVGARSNIQDGTVIHVARDGQGTDIGDDVLIGHMAMIHACTIRRGALIGMTACILDDAVVEEEAMVAAGALVTPGKRVAARELWAGRPARSARKLTETDLAVIRDGVQHYCELSAEYRQERAQR